MKPTDTRSPGYYHRVVDCQWACPAHTDVPQYLRLVAQGEYTESYLLNRLSNVFPGILGRVCDRPCEPACRRGRIDDKPVAICRVKRTAADYKDDVSSRLPEIPTEKNGRRIACVGAGPASLTVANDLLPLGYEIVMFERLEKPGGLMRSNIPSFRLPVNVLDEEIGMIVDMGVDLRLGSPVESMKSLLEVPPEKGGYDAVFVGSGAPRGRDLSLPGRDESDKIHTGIEWLESVAFKHISEISPRVVIIGGGNTALDCYRTSPRLGGKDVKVVARKPRELLKCSDWELEEAEEELGPVICNHSPERFIVEDGVLTGVEFAKVEWYEDDAGKLRSKTLEKVVFPCDEVILAIGQETAFPWIEPDSGVEFNERGAPIVDPRTYQSTNQRVFFGGDAAFGPENIIWAVEHGHQAAISIDRICSEQSVQERLPPTLNLVSYRMGLNQWSYSNDWDPEKRLRVPHVPNEERFSDPAREVEEGFDQELARREAERCLNCDIQTDFTASLCIECDACIDVCPVDCLTITDNGTEADLRSRLSAPAENREQPLYISEALPQTGRIMVKDENICLHCGLCAERCPTGAWDMRKSIVNMRYAGDDGAERRQQQRVAPTESFLPKESLLRAKPKRLQKR